MSIFDKVYQVVKQIPVGYVATCGQIAEAVGSTRVPLSLSIDSDGGEQQLDVPTPDISPEITERLTLRQALLSLEKSDRQLIGLRYYQGKTQVQTAALLGMTQVQVSRREKKILAQIRVACEG